MLPYTQGNRLCAKQRTILDATRSSPKGYQHGISKLHRSQKAADQTQIVRPYIPKGTGYAQNTIKSIIT